MRSNGPCARTGCVRHKVTSPVRRNGSYEDMAHVDASVTPLSVRRNGSFDDAAHVAVRVSPPVRRNGSFETWECQLEICESVQY